MTPTEFGFLLLVVTLTFTIPNVYCELDYLLYTTPGTSQTLGGLYGGRVNVGNRGAEVNLYETGYNRAKVGQTFHWGIQAMSQSYDPVSQNILVSIDPNFRSRLTLVKGPLCAGKARIFRDTIIKYAQIVDPLGTSNLFLTFKTGIKSIAYYNSKIYLILSGIYGMYGGNMRHNVELRLLEGCEDKAERLKTGFLYKFDLVRCSRLISTVVSRDYTDYQGYTLLDSGTDLKVINHFGQLVSFIQVMNYTRNDTRKHQILNVDVLLYMVTALGDKTLLHRHSINPRYVSAYVDHLGGIDYRNGVICWSTISEVHCGKLDINNSKLNNVITVVKEGETSSENICRTSDHLYYENVTTGVVIAEASPMEYAVYFGCFAQLMHSGGAGLVVVRTNGTKRHLYPVKSGNATVLAGGMFMVKGPIAPCVTQAPTTVIYPSFFPLPDSSPPFHKRSAPLPKESNLLPTTSKATDPSFVVSDPSFITKESLSMTTDAPATAASAHSSAWQLNISSSFYIILSTVVLFFLFRNH